MNYKYDEWIYGHKSRPRFWRSDWVWTYKKHTQPQK